MTHKRKHARFSRHRIALLISTLGTCSHTMAQIVVDPNAPASQQATILRASDGSPLANIRTPNASGLSRNTYRQFDVGAQGIHLNNSTSNPWLSNGVTATTILNEVNSANPIKDIPGSTDCICALANSLEGYLEALFCAQFQRLVFIRGFADEDPVRFKKTVLVAKQCALIAGGYEYYDFWAGLLGLPDTDTIPES